MAYCDSCGKQVKETAKFCNGCGKQRMGSVNAVMQNNVAQVRNAPKGNNLLASAATGAAAVAGGLLLKDGIDGFAEGFAERFAGSGATDAVCDGAATACDGICDFLSNLFG